MIVALKLKFLLLKADYYFEAANVIYLRIKSCIFGRYRKRL